MTPKGSKQTLRASLEHVAKQLKRKPRQLELLTAIDLPETTGYVWWWYQELFNGGKLTWQEIDAWSRLTRRTLLPWEVSTIRSIDTTYLRIQHDGRR